MLVLEDQAQWNSNYMSEKQTAPQERESGMQTARKCIRRVLQGSSQGWRGPVARGKAGKKRVCVVKDLVCPTRSQSLNSILKYYNIETSLSATLHEITRVILPAEMPDQVRHLFGPVMKHRVILPPREK